MMTKVSNGKLVRRLAFRGIKANRKMNIVVVLSIILTCLMFTTLFLVGGGLINGLQQETMRQVGGNRMAGFKYARLADYEKVKADKAVKDAVYTVLVGNLVDEKLKGCYVEVNYANDEEAAKAAFSCPEVGNLPKAYDEMATSTIALDALGVPHELGTKFTVNMEIDGEVKEHEFVLSGYWEGDSINMAQMGWVSDAFREKWAKEPKLPFDEQKEGGVKYAGYMSINFNFSNSFNIMDKAYALATRVYGDKANVNYIGVNWAYMTENFGFEYLIIILILAFIMFTAGYLIIYNIFNINISSNIRYYGLLKTIGTSAKQIKKMINLQALVYCLEGIPAGIVLGVLVGKVLYNGTLKTIVILSKKAYVENTKVTILMVLIAIIFTIITVMISCRKPGKIAGRVSPMEALRYNDTNIEISKKKKTTKKVTPFSIAKNNMLRGRKKTIIVVLSLVLSIIMVNIVGTIIMSVDMDKYIKLMVVGDINLLRDKNYDDYDMNNLIKPEYLEEAKDIDGVTDVASVYYLRGNMKFIGEGEKRLELYYSKYASQEELSYRTYSTEDSLSADIYGISERLLDSVDIQEGEIDYDKWRTGNYVIAYTADAVNQIENDEDNLVRVGEKIKLGWDASKEFEVMAIGQMAYPVSTQEYTDMGGYAIIPDNEYFKLVEERNASCSEEMLSYFADENCALSAVLYVEDGRTEEVKEKLQPIIDQPGSFVVMKSKQDYMNEIGDLILLIKLGGGLLAGVLSFISILNFANVIITSIVSRKREFAMMNAAGMTGRQLKQMVMGEGINYAVITSIISIVLGAIVNELLVKPITNEIVLTSYHFTVVPICSCIAILFILALVIPYLSYKIICRDSIVERIRDN